MTEINQVKKKFKMQNIILDDLKLYVDLSNSMHKLQVAKYAVCIDKTFP